MPGLCGFVAGEKYRADPRDKLLDFDRVQTIPGIKYINQSWYSSRCALLNVQTGLLPGSSKRHAQTTQLGIHLFLEGEVYNYEELLDLSGVVQPSDRKECSPDQTLLKLFIKEGSSFIRHVRGEFAVAIYEERSHRLQLFTDHLATKSIYYLIDNEGLFFGAEKKSILSASISSVSLDPVGLLEVFALTHNIGNRTFISQIRCVPPASHLLFDCGKLIVGTYWHHEFNIPNHQKLTLQLRDQWTELLTRAVARRVRGKRRLILSLSGGLDSRAVVCAFPRDLRPLAARTRGDNDSLEVQYATAIARRLGLDHYVDNPDPQVSFSKFLERVVWRTECSLPFTYCLSITDHDRIAERADFIIGGQFGDIGSGGHIRPFMLMPQSRDAFLNNVLRRYLTHSLPKLSTIFTDDFLKQTFPELCTRFLASFREINSHNSNIQLYEIWDMINRQPRLTLNAQKVDSHRFEKIYPLLDFDYLQFALTLPFRLRFGQALYHSMIWMLGPEIRDIPYEKTNRPLSISPLVNQGNRLLYYKDRVIEAIQTRWGPSSRKTINQGPPLHLDLGLRELLESYLSSSEFDNLIFDAAKIRTVLKEYYEGGTNDGSLISILATFAVGIPLFLRKGALRMPASF